MTTHDRLAAQIRALAHEESCLADAGHAVACALLAQDPTRDDTHSYYAILRRIRLLRRDIEADLQCALDQQDQIRIDMERAS
jgi:hypothetical protein